MNIPTNRRITIPPLIGVPTGGVGGGGGSGGVCPMALGTTNNETITKSNSVARIFLFRVFIQRKSIKKNEFYKKHPFNFIFFSSKSMRFSTICNKS